jgi:hypothetical protein
LALSASHGPGAYLAAIEAMAGEADHGHSHDQDQGSSPQHDASDHEHLVLVILTDPQGSFVSIACSLRHVDPDLTNGNARDGPRRPPRSTVL